MTNSLPYILLIISLQILSASEIFIRFDKKSIQFLNFLVFSIFLLFFGFRGFIGWDWFNYYPYFSKIKPINEISLITTNYEIGFEIYTSLIKTISKNYQFFIFISTLIDGILLHFFIKKYLPKNLYAFAFTTFIVMEGLVMEVNLMRNFKALLLFLISLQYIEKRNFLKFSIINIMGLAFHWSSLIFFPLYFVIHKKVELRVFIGIFIIGNIIYLAQIEYIKPAISFISKYLGSTVEIKTEAYLNSSLFNKQYTISLGYFERIATTFLIMFHYNKLIEKSKYNIIFINSFIIFFIFYFYFSEVSIVVSRLGNLFIFSYWILWPQIIDTISNTMKYLIFGILCLFLTSKIHKTTNNDLFRYDNSLFKNIQPYKDRVNIFLKVAPKLEKQK